MARKPSRQDQLKAQAKALRKNLTTKVSRIERVHGVKVANTNLDVRKSAREIDSMSTRELTSYIGKANTFLDRKTGFVRGHDGVALPLAEWRKYQAVARKNNRLTRSSDSRFLDRIVPGTKETVRERLAKGDTSMSVMRDAVSRRPRDMVDVSSARGITSVRALRRLTKALERKNKADYLPKSIKKTRATMRKALTKLGDKQSLAKMRRLSDESIDFLWNYAGLAESVFTRYENIKESTATELVSNRGFDAADEIEDTRISELIQGEIDYQKGDR